MHLKRSNIIIVRPNALQTLKHYDDAKDILAQSLEIFLKTLKHEHPLVRSVERNIERNLSDLRDLTLHLQSPKESSSNSTTIIMEDSSEGKTVGDSDDNGKDIVSNLKRKRDMSTKS